MFCPIEPNGGINEKTTTTNNNSETFYFIRMMCDKCVAIPFMTLNLLEKSSYCPIHFIAYILNECL